MKNFLQRRGVLLAQMLVVFSLVGVTVVYAFGKHESAPKKEEEIVADEEGQDETSVKEVVEAVLEKTEEKLTPVLKEDASLVEREYPVHKNIATTLFWVGEDASEDNKHISNTPSAWDEDWMKHYGGVDSPKKRNGYFPAKFTPKENPFYFALPYNDFNEQGKRRQEVSSFIPWAASHTWKNNESMLKNRWIKISKNGRVAYAQWQDVGPFKEDDGAYVFGSAQPKSKTNNHAGLDVSPAVHDYLDLTDVDTTDWQFVEEADVPDGPWKKIVTRSQVYWK